MGGMVKTGQVVKDRGTYRPGVFLMNWANLMSWIDWLNDFAVNLYLEFTGKLPIVQKWPQNRAFSLIWKKLLLIFAGNVLR